MEEVGPLVLGFRMELRDPFKLLRIVPGVFFHPGQLPLLPGDLTFQLPVWFRICRRIAVRIHVQFWQGHVKPDSFQGLWPFLLCLFWDLLFWVLKEQGEIPPAVRFPGHRTVFEQPALPDPAVDPKTHRIFDLREF